MTDKKRPPLSLVPSKPAAPETVLALGLGALEPLEPAPRRELLPAGTRIVCPNCRLPTAILARDFRAGDPMEADLFSPVVGRRGTPSLHCVRCRNQPVFRAGQLYTDHGWQP